MKRPALFLILGLVIGAVAGSYATTRWWARLSHESLDVLVIATRGQYAYLQYQNAKPRDAETALNEYLRALDSVQAHQNTRRSVWMIDKGLTLVRLSNVESMLGNKAEADRNLTEAQEAFRAAGWKDTSVEHITAAVERLDKGPRADGR